MLSFVKKWFEKDDEIYFDFNKVKFCKGAWGVPSNMKLTPEIILQVSKIAREFSDSEFCECGTLGTVELYGKAWCDDCFIEVV